MSVRFALALGLTLAFRFWLGAALPITGDEAYFIWWGWRPDWGFYDHPPMVGWWLAALSAASNAEGWLRLPSIVLPALLAVAVAWALPRLWPGVDRARSEAVALLVLLAPANVWNVLITTDTPLVFFSVLSALAWVRAAQEREGDGFGWYALSGVLLAGAVLSKYFVALLGFAYLIDVLRRRTGRALVGLAIAYGCCVPALLLMGWWNAGHCWPNYMFNFVNRHGKAGASATTPLLYGLSLLYLLTPPAVWLAWRSWRAPNDSGFGGVGAHPSSALHSLAPAPGATHASRNPGRRPASADLRGSATLATLFLVPFALFALLSIPKTIGLHWLLTFVPLALVWLGLRLPAGTLNRLLRFFVGFAVLHVAAIVTIAQLPLETWSRKGFYDSAVLTVAPGAFAERIAQVRAATGKDWVLAMDGYSNAVTLGYNLREHVLVFGEGSSHARHDDIQTDFRTLEGKDFLILQKGEPKPGEYAPYFANVTIDPFEVRSATFWQIRGEGFRYAAYRDQVLRRVKDKYYQVPAWLPQTACYLCDRYFPGEPCVK